MEGTRQSVTLLKNDAKLLPLSKAAIKSAAVIGPNSLLSEQMSSYYGDPHV